MKRRRRRKMVIIHLNWERSAPNTAKTAAAAAAKSHPKRANAVVAVGLAMVEG
jgi:hypothetical protein